MTGQPLEILIKGLLETAGTALSPLGAGIMAAASQNLSHDSRSFARKLDIAHALVIRECVTLSDDLALIDLEDREDRSQRLFYQLSAKGQSLIEEAARA